MQISCFVTRLAVTDSRLSPLTVVPPAARHFQEPQHHLDLHGMPSRQVCIMQIMWRQLCIGLTSSAGTCILCLFRKFPLLQWPQNLCQNPLLGLCALMCALELNLLIWRASASTQLVLHRKALAIRYHWICFKLSKQELLYSHAVTCQRHMGNGPRLSEYKIVEINLG